MSTSDTSALGDTSFKKKQEKKERTNEKETMQEASEEVVASRVDEDGG